MNAQDKQMGVVDQVMLAFKARNRLATMMGFLLGGVVPVATYLEAHADLDKSLPLHTQVATYLVLGGLAFSAKTVFDWAKLAFDNGFKAAGFVLLLEGVMITSGVPVLPLVLLAVLVGINGIATGCILSLGRAKSTPVEKAETAAPVKRAPRSRKRRVSGVDLKAA
jgi:hypothetical protein